MRFASFELLSDQPTIGSGDPDGGQPRRRPISERAAGSVSARARDTARIGRRQPPTPAAMPARRRMRAWTGRARLSHKSRIWGRSESSAPSRGPRSSRACALDELGCDAGARLSWRKRACRPPDLCRPAIAQAVALVIEQTPARARGALPGGTNLSSERCPVRGDARLPRRSGSAFRAGRARARLLRSRASGHAGDAQRECRLGR